MSNFNIYFFKKENKDQSLYDYDLKSHGIIDKICFTHHVNVNKDWANFIIEKMVKYDNNFSKLCFNWNTVFRSCEEHAHFDKCKNICNCFSCSHYFCNLGDDCFTFENLSMFNNSFQPKFVNVKEYITNFIKKNNKNEKSQLFQKSICNSNNSSQEFFSCDNSEM